MDLKPEVFESFFIPSQREGCGWECAQKQGGVSKSDEKCGSEWLVKPLPPPSPRKESHILLLLLTFRTLKV